MRVGGVILCGGRSRRMGRDKASLPFGPGETLLSATLGRVRQSVNGPAVCVAAPGQALPPLPAEVLVAHDRTPDGGPLEALAIGLSAVEGLADAVVAVGCDTPLVSPALLRVLAERLGAAGPSAPAAVPVVGGQRQPLLAAYRQSVARHARELLSAGARSLNGLLDAIEPAQVAEAELRAIDPPLDSLLNCNDQATYEAALHAAGIDHR
ncbi:MAG: molybdenum cofactor guanylyltransferase [Planctomycetota bacterium]